MAKLNMSLESPVALYEHAQRVRRGEVDAGPLRLAFIELEKSLEPVCQVLDDWTSGFAGSDHIMGLGWSVSYKIASDTHEPETALIDREKAKYYLLAGDHRQAFKAVAPQGWNALWELFQRLNAEENNRHPCSAT